MSVVHIYRIPQVIELTTATGAELMNYPVNRTDFRISKYVDNEIEFWVKNIDRRAVALTGSILTMHITDIKNNKILLTRELTVVDAAKGLVRLFVSGDEAAAMPLGFMHYSIVMLRPDDVTVMLYTDRERKGLGNIEVISGPIPAPLEPTYLSLADFITLVGKQYSSPLPGAAMVNNLSGQHSLVIDYNEFIGKISVQGTLEPQPSHTSDNWFTVTTDEHLTATTLLKNIAFEGNLMWVRVVVERQSGNVDSFQYRT
jgi:hypothetical protein